MTPGQRFPNVALTRDLLTRVDLAGTRCLDIGTMEGMIPVLMKRQGAAEVLAVDGLDFSDKIACVKAAYDVDFAYLPSIMSGSLLRAIVDRRDGEITRHRYAGGPAPRAGFGFDVVVCSGVLYHVYSPFHVLATARSAVRPGGLMIRGNRRPAAGRLSDAVQLRGHGLSCSARRIRGFPTIPLLDHFMRFLKLVPLDACWLSAGEGLVRFACVARAVDHQPTLPTERC